jgi:hypothetical protein
MSINKKVFGYGLVIPVVDGANMEEPYNIDGIKKGSYKGMTVVEPYWLSPELDQEAVGNPASKYFYIPTWYKIAGGKRIHRSWVIKVINSEVSDVLKPSYYFGGVPLTQQIYERVFAAEKVANEAPLLALTKRLLVADANIENMVANPEKAAEIMAQVTYFRDNFAVWFKNPNDTVNQIDTSLADFDAMVMTQYQLVASIAEMPATKLLKTTPKGFNSTGDYEQDDYNQSLIEIQENDYTPLIDRHNELMTKSDYGKVIKLKVTFNPIDTPTEKEVAEVDEIKSRTAGNYINSGILSPSEERNILRTDPEGRYTSLSNEILEDGESFYFGLEEENSSANDEWEENDHPRDSSGKFSSGGSSSSNNIDDDILGKEYTDVKGQEAINKLIEEKQGHVKNAFHRDDVGNIDLVWGNDNYGLKHIIKRRNEQGIDVDKFISDLSDVIEKGSISKNEKGNFEILHSGKMAIVSPELQGNKITFLLTAFKTRKKK